MNACIKMISSKATDETHQVLSITKQYSIASLKKTGNCFSKIVSEYDQEIPQSQTADNPIAPRGRAAQPSRDTRKAN